jgi:formylglycine-generating enzyme required for sulfatase activity
LYGYQSIFSESDFCRAMTNIFISYRRDDSRYQADRLYKALTQVLPRERVFMDIDSIKPGDDFVDILEGWVQRCDILLALIGTGWINATDPKTGKRRLDNPNDFVRIEVREALKRGIPVAPVLLDGASMPEADELPDDLKKLLRRHAQFVDFRTFDTDVATLINRLGLGKSPAQPRPETPQQRPLWTRAEKAARTPDARQAAASEEPESDADLPQSLGEKGWAADVATIAESLWRSAAGALNSDFQDFEGGPEMVVVPAGSFMMGSPEDEPERESWRKGAESPQHRVTIQKPFAVGRFTVTRGQFAVFVSATGYKTQGGAYVWTGSEYKLNPEKSWRDPGFAQDDSHPTVCVNWDDAKAYIGWLNGKAAGQPYRLLSEAEWEHACRAGTDTPFWWGSSITPEQANYNGNYVYAGGGTKGAYREKTMPVAGFQPNPWGLYQVHGNVWELCADCWNDNYKGAPEDGTAWTTGHCTFHVLRGGSWYNDPRDLRAAYRSRSGTGIRFNDVGFRVARTL